MQHSSSGKLVTVFGGSGFIGAQLVRKLAKHGYRVRVATRKPNERLALKPSGDLGQIALVKADVRVEEQVRSAISGSDIVINLAGIMRPGKGQTFDSVNVWGGETISKACAALGVSRLIHMSALGADENSTSKYLRSKSQGEAAVKKNFAAATILRPSAVFGAGDQFFNKLAALMKWSRIAFPAFGSGKTKFQPVYVGDVAEAVVRVLEGDKAKGRVYELAGPSVYSLNEILNLISQYCGRPVRILPMPFILLDLGALLTGWLPFAPITFDQAKLLRTNFVLNSGFAFNAIGTLADLGISPTSVEAVVPGYLYAHRPCGQYSEHRHA